MSKRTKAEARVFLIARWHEECERYPLMREQIPLARYVAANLQQAMKYAR
jgi:hypothetical protein